MKKELCGKNMELGSMCRACLVILAQDEGHSLLENGLTLRFSECSMLTIDKFDEFPKCICNNCFEMLNTCHEFQNMCAESMENFKNCINEQFYAATKQQQYSPLGDYAQDMDEKTLDTTRGINTKTIAEKIIDNGLDVQCMKEHQSGTQQHGDYANDVGFKNTTEKQNEYSAESCDDRPRNARRARKSISCANCQKKFYKQERLLAHLREHSGLKPYVCTVCCLQFTRSHTLRVHIARRHNENAGITRFHCTAADCDKSYTTLYSLNQHVAKAHTAANEGKNKTSMCHVCGKVFAHGSLLSRHRFVHMDAANYPFGCSHCPKRFYTKQLLQQHLFSHSGREQTRVRTKSNRSNRPRTTKLAECTVCAKQFSNNSNLKMHIRTVHEGRCKYACRFCEQRFTRYDNLKNHELRHLGSRPHKCVLCGGAFLQKATLNTHMKRMHKRKSEIYITDNTALDPDTNEL